MAPRLHTNANNSDLFRGNHFRNFLEQLLAGPKEMERVGRSLEVLACEMQFHGLLFESHPILEAQKPENIQKWVVCDQTIVRKTGVLLKCKAWMRHSPTCIIQELASGSLQMAAVPY